MMKITTTSNHLLTITLLISIQIIHHIATATTTSNTTNLTQPFDTAIVLPSYVDRIFSLSTTSPVAASLRSNPHAETTLNQTFDFIETLDRVIQTRKRDNHSEACNLAFQYSWSLAYQKFTPGYQIGEPDTDCFSRLDINNAAEARTLLAPFRTSARDIMRRTRDLLYTASITIRFPNDSNWSSLPVKLVPRIRRRASQECHVDSVSAYRRDGVWYLRSAVTNRDVDEYLPDGQRHTVIEWIPRTLDKSLSMIHPNHRTRALEESTTLLVVWRGRAVAGTFGASGTLDDPVSPTTQAYRQNLVAVDLAKDSVTVSNIAILALPMVMNIVPFSFVAELTGVGMLVYVLVTDVFSAVPLLVKGVELVRSSELRREVIGSFHAGSSSVGLIEAWWVECHGQNRFRTTGIVFITVALAAMIVGTLIEIWAHGLIMTLKKNGKAGAPVQGPFGPILLEESMTGLLGSRRSQQTKRVHFSQAVRNDDEYDRGLSEVDDDPLVGAASLQPARLKQSVLSQLVRGDELAEGSASVSHSDKKQ